MLTTPFLEREAIFQDFQLYSALCLSSNSVREFIILIYRFLPAPCYRYIATELTHGSIPSGYDLIMGGGGEPFT